jgi:hypothetical protein
MLFLYNVLEIQLPDDGLVKSKHVVHLALSHSHS